jgi:tape measure domain-containing protein
MAERLGTAELLLTADPKPLQAGLRQAEQSVRRWGDDATRTTEKMRSGFGALQGALGALGVGLSIGAVVAGLKSAASAAAELESITRRLENTLGQQGAAGALGFTRQLADQLGLSFKGLAGSFASFTAAATAAQVSLDQQKELFAAVARSGQALGLSNDAINGSLLALQQVAAKGTVQMEELRGQLGERLPIAFAATARGLGITSRELIKLVESGKLSATQFFPALTKGLNELTSGATGAGTAAQQYERLKDALDQLNTAIGQAILPALTIAAGNLTKALKGLGAVARQNSIADSFNAGKEQAKQLSGVVDGLINRFPELSFTQARRLLSDALAETEGTRNIFGGLELSSEKLVEVIGRLTIKAREFTAAGREAAALRDKEAADAEAALKAADLEKQARLVAAAQRNTSTREQLADLLRTRGLQDEQLARAQDLLAVESARRNVARAMLAYDDAAATAGGDPVRLAAAANEIAEAQARVGIAIEEATRRAADRLKDAASLVKSSAEALRGAREGFAGAVGQAFAIATNQQRERARAINEERIRAAERAGAFDPARVAYRYGLGMQGGQLQLQSLTFRQLERLAGEVGTLANAEKTLQTAMSENTSALKQLAARKWEVQVNVRQNLGGDMAVNTINNLR